VGDLDLFRDEVAGYAQRLAEAGVEVEFHLIPGLVHAGEIVAPGTALSVETNERRWSALARDLARV
jgi:acetyl esterase/lipase